MRSYLENSDYRNSGQYSSKMCAYIAGKISEIRYNAQTLPLVGEMLEDGSLLRQSYFFIAMLLACFGLINNALSLITFTRDRIRFTVGGVYSIVLSACGLVMMGSFLLNIIFALHNDNHSSQLWTCHLYPYLFLVMSNISLLMSAAMAIETIMYRCFGFDRFRTRKGAVLISVNLCVLVCLSNVDKIYARHVLPERSGRFVCTYEDYSRSLWSDINNGVASIYLVIVCLIHFMCITFLLLKIKRQNQQWSQKISMYLDILLPSCLIILCSIPYLALRYIANGNDLFSKPFYIHLYIGCILVVNMPSMLTFFIYVLPNRYYVREVQRLCTYRCLPSKQAQVEEFELEYKNWHQRATVESVMTISALNDYYIRGEMYDKIKLEV